MCLPFPGHACFLCEDDSDLRTTGSGVKAECTRCSYPIDKMTQPELIRHMGVHILHDPVMQDVVQPCGLCLGTGCKWYIMKGRGTGAAETINMNDSRCPNLRNKKFRLKNASVYTENSPCTNVPMQCPVCIKLPSGTRSPAVWKYNLKDHILQQHSDYNIELYKGFFELTAAEVTDMKGQASKPHRVVSAKPKRAKGPELIISEAHSARLALRYVNFIEYSSNAPIKMILKLP